VSGLGRQKVTSERNPSGEDEDRPDHAPVLSDGASCFCNRSYSPVVQRSGAARRGAADVCGASSARGGEAARWLHAPASAAGGCGGATPAGAKAHAHRGGIVTRIKISCSTSLDFLLVLFAVQIPHVRDQGSSERDDRDHPILHS
jgi:hypothetical protein